MSRFCSNCGQPSPPAHDGVHLRYCGSCGHPYRDQPATPESNTRDSAIPGATRESRRRSTLALAVAIFALLATLVWILTQPSSANSPARGLKTAVFGRRVTQAVEDALNRAANGSSSTGQGQGETRDSSNEAGNGNPQGHPEGSDGSTHDGSQGGGSGTNSARSQARGGSSRANREGGSDRMEQSDPSPNEQLPDQPPPSQPPPPERSIGFLTWFFGTTQPSHQPTAGEGGTGTTAGTGGTHTSIPTPSTPDQSVAADPAPTNRSAISNQPPTPVTVRGRQPSNAPGVVTFSDQDLFENTLRQAGAGSGDVRISLMWNNYNDLDLHVVDPSGVELNYNHRTSPSGGLLDIDRNRSGTPLENPAVENVYWPRQAAAPGRYRIFVNCYSIHPGGPAATPFTVRVLIKGTTKDFKGTVRKGPKLLVHTFDLPR